MTDLKVKALARIVHEANKGYCESIGDHSQVTWNKAPEYIKRSAIQGVQKVLDNPDITPEEMHRNWMDFKVADGWVYGETKDAEKKTHPCITAYENLDVKQRFKDTLFISIIKTYLDFKGREAV